MKTSETLSRYDDDLSSSKRVVSNVPPITNLIAFEAVARRRSFSLAASELHLTASAISHQVARLESHLQTRLFERNAKGVWLTTAGEKYLARVSGALSAITAATEDLQQGVSNSLYVHSAPSFATLWLLPRLHRFARAYPDISLNLSAEHTPSDFAAGQSDLDIRYGVPRWRGLEVVPLFQERIVPLASPSFIASRRISRPEQLLDMPLIQSNVSVVQWADWFAACSDKRAPERFGLRFDRAQMSIDAATQGLGVALESVVIAATHLAEGKLSPIFGLEKSVRVQAHFAVYPAGHARRPSVQAFLAWMKEESKAM